MWIQHDIKFMKTENNNRRDFIKKSCLSSACLCGFTSIFQSATGQPLNNTEIDDPNKALMQEWISSLLLSISNHEDESLCRTIVKKCSIVHYSHLNMDKVLEPFVGNIGDFINFLEQNWGWKIIYGENGRSLIADENKDYCVCPLVNKSIGIKSSILCYCSEGIAELMFSKVFNHSVKATVISSIHRGGTSCQYVVNF